MRVGARGGDRAPAGRGDRFHRLQEKHGAGGLRRARAPVAAGLGTARAVAGTGATAHVRSVWGSGTVAPARPSRCS